MSDVMETPFVQDGQEYPILKLRSIGRLSGLYRANQEKNIRGSILEEKMNVEQRARFLALTAAIDPQIENIYDWAISLDGSMAIVKQSLLQLGKNEEEADKIIDNIKTPDILRRIAFEVIDHPYTPKNVKAREEEAAKNAATVDNDKKKAS